jgi:hypothetical protein
MIINRVGAFVDPITFISYLPWTHFRTKRLWLVQVFTKTKIQIVNVIADTPKEAVEKAKISKDKVYEIMDKKIKRIIKDTKHVEKEGKSLLKADKKRDKVCDYGEKMMKKKGK